ncbi:phage tail protein [Rubrivivax albus]|nr:tail fiber protein [Rubrivivax albus]
MRITFAAAAMLAAMAAPLPAAAQSEPFIGQIMCTGFNFTPRGWARLDGQLLPIAQYSALYSLLGTTYGGDGRTTFALPDMRGRALVHDGNGPGLTPRTLGERGGAETHTLTPSQMPAHTHTVAPRASTAAPTASSPAGGVPATRPRLPMYGAAPGDTDMATATTSVAGGNQPVPQMPPYVTVSCFMALQGIYPSRE